MMTWTFDMGGEPVVINWDKGKVQASDPIIQLALEFALELPYATAPPLPRSIAPSYADETSAWITVHSVIDDMTRAARITNIVWPDDPVPPLTGDGFGIDGSDTVPDGVTANRSAIMAVKDNPVAFGGPGSGRHAGPGPWEDQPTAKAAEQEIAKRYGTDPQRIGTSYALSGQPLGRTFLFKGMSAESANAVASTIDSMFKEYPGASHYVGLMGTAGEVQRYEKARFPQYKIVGNGQSIASAIGKIGSIRFHGGFMKDHARWVDVEAAGKESGFSSSGTPQGTVAHEIGHIVDYAARQQPEYQTEIENAVAELRASGGGVAESLSRYGATNRFELVAEAIAEAHTSPEPRPFAVKIAEIAKRYSEAEFARANEAIDRQQTP